MLEPDGNSQPIKPGGCRHLWIHPTKKCPPFLGGNSCYQLHEHLGLTQDHDLSSSGADATHTNLNSSCSWLFPTPL